ncbi:glycine cleavage system protein GcvH [Pseudomonas typographi]|uniref:Glycine cleavage system H protein n=1 Tax=Pseudomonas typographi TaxID=2715964 RepID=A0ABR7YXD5_9PSED|nr:glycine cleavage system protein GcvH [Pseudomonas typographi]MBD1550975.1 glycine cleavage system protein GcvH [Pseudomonas typographi]MBD1585800.1 glycine cleavage system protein GcvH [Pseudomonas typographi]MBD1597874.1 glycine cleavage system protein GcvH [Pseudomonas typographi]
MSELRFTVEHEWLRAESDGSVTVGITEFAQQALGDVVYVQLPELRAYAVGAEVSVVESVKAASSINMPLAGTVLEANLLLAEAPERANEAPLGEGWFFRFRPDDASAMADLLDQAAYDQLIANQG